MNLRQLRYFAKVIETGNMTRAASELHVAQPARGMQIRQPEEGFDVALLVRHSRGVAAWGCGRLGSPTLPERCGRRGSGAAERRLPLTRRPRR
jgi:hypothetical protein